MTGYKILVRKDTFDQEKGTREFFELIDKEFVLIKKITFEYDKKDNWTKAISYIKDSYEKNSSLKPETIVEREVTYYE